MIEKWNFDDNLKILGLFFSQEASKKRVVIF